MNKIEQNNFSKDDFHPIYGICFGYFGRLMQSFIVVLSFAFLSFSPALAHADNPGDGSVMNQSQVTAPSIRENYEAAGNPAAKINETYERTHSAGGPFTDTSNGGFPTTFTRAPFPGPGGPSTYTINTGSGELDNALQKEQSNFKIAGAQGGLTDNEDFGATATAVAMQAQRDNDPAAAADSALAAGSAMSTSAANSMAGAAVSQAMGAIQFTQHYLVNFTAQNNSWQSLRNNLFVPIAILLLLPGAVLAQVRAIVAQSSTILGEVNPFEGITRSIVAIFMIPASFLVVNYGIDLANALTYGINTEYTNLFGTDMYQDAQCAEMRAFPVNSSSQNTNAFIPAAASAASSALSSMGGNSPWTSFEATGLAQKLFDPCVGLDQSLIPDESSSSTMNTNRLMMNGSNSFLAMTWNIMCAFQTVFLYYLWCMGPIVAALWVWPMERLRAALPSWIEGVVTLCFWSLFWNVVVLLMACFRGVSETGTVIMTALNSLATISVWYAFDFSALISEGAGYSMMNAISQSMSQATKGGGGGGASGGGQKQAAGGGGSRQSAGGGGMGQGLMGGDGNPAAANAGIPGGSRYASTGSTAAFGGVAGGAVAGGLAPTGHLGNMATASSGAPMGGVPGWMPSGSGSPGNTGSLSSKGISPSSTSNYADIDKAVNNQLTPQQAAQQKMNEAQLAKQEQDKQDRLASFNRAAQENQNATFGDYLRQHQQQQQQQQTEKDRVNAQLAANVLGQQHQEAEKHLQDTNMKEYLSHAKPAEQARLAQLFNARLGTAGLNLDGPPTVGQTTARGMGASGGGNDTNLGNNILLTGTAGPPLSDASFARSAADLPPLVTPSPSNLPDLPVVPFSGGTLSSAPLITTSTSFTSVDGGVSPDISYTTTNAPAQPADTYTVSADVPYTTGTEYSYSGTDYTTSGTGYTSSGTDSSGSDAVYRTENTIGWSNVGDANRGSVSEQSAIVQPVNLSQAQAQYTNQVAAEQQQQQLQLQQQQQQQQQQQVQYVPAEVKHERVEVQQIQPPAKQVQEKIVQQQQKPAPQPVKPNVQKPINAVIPVFGSPPAASKSGNSISSLLAGMQKGGKPNANQSSNQNLSGGTLSRDSNAKGPEHTTTGSLADHLGRLQRGGGRTAPKAKDILSELGLPPQSEDEEEEKKDT